jgi:hypothetical protein
MDDNQTNNGNTEHGPKNQIKTVQQSHWDRTKAFVRANARKE